jgi:putative membrane protein
VRAFGQLMIDHHTMSSQKLMTAAQQAGMPPPPQALPADKAARIRALSGAHGAAFDRMYMREQVMGHEEALAIHRGFSNTGDSPPLKAVAAQAVPIVQQHLTRANEISARVR